MNRIGKLTGVLLGAAAFSAVTAASAQAAPLQVWLCTAGPAAGCTTVVDQQAGVDVNPVVGAITVVGLTGNTVISTSYPVSGSTTEPYLNLTYSAPDLAPGQQLWLYAQQDAFTFQGGLDFLANATDGSGLATVFMGPGVFPGPGGGAAVPGCTALPYTSEPAPGTDAQCSFNAPAAPYYLAIGLAITADTTGNATGDATIEAQVPEPATMSLFGLGLLSLGLAARRRQQQQ